MSANKLALTCRAAIFSPVTFLRLRWNCVIFMPWEFFDWLSLKPHLSEARWAICQRTNDELSAWASCAASMRIPRPRLPGRHLGSVTRLACLSASWASGRRLAVSPTFSIFPFRLLDKTPLCRWSRILFRVASHFPLQGGSLVVPNGVKCRFLASCPLDCQGSRHHKGKWQLAALKYTTAY